MTCKSAHFNTGVTYICYYVATLVEVNASGLPTGVVGSSAQSVDFQLGQAAPNAALPTFNFNRTLVAGKNDMLYGEVWMRVGANSIKINDAVASFST